MIREVDLSSYLPPFMQNYKESVAALETENPEFFIVWKATDRVLYNHFIATADEYGISRFEKLLNIYPSSEDTLESRRSRIQSKWFNTIPYTWKILLQKLTVLCNNTDFTISNNFTEGYTMTLNTDLELFGQVEELEYIINTMFPSNIVVDSKNNILCNIGGVVLFGGGICFVNSFTITNDFREVNQVQGDASFCGGIVQTEFAKITNDSKETIAINGSASFGGGLVDTAMSQVTDGFREAVQTSGDVNAASGIVQVDFIEIKSN